MKPFSKLSNALNSARLQRRRLLGLVSGLVINAVLGISLTTVIDFDSSKHGSWQTIVLGTHVIIAIGLILGGIVQLASTIRTRTLRTPSVIGLLGSIAAFVAGASSVDSGNDVAVFIMAVCFIIALCAYGYCLASIGLKADGKSRRSA